MGQHFTQAVAASPKVTFCLPGHEVAGQLFSAGSETDLLTNRIMIQFGTASPKEAVDAEHWFSEQNASFRAGAIWLTRPTYFYLNFRPRAALITETAAIERGYDEGVFGVSKFCCGVVVIDDEGRHRDIENPADKDAKIGRQCLDLWSETSSIGTQRRLKFNVIATFAQFFHCDQPGRSSQASSEFRWPDSLDSS